MLGLPDRITGLLFDMDGVLTRTAEVHAGAWKQAFDAVLEQRADGGEFTPFDAVSDYDEFVDGKSRLDGVRSFLQARGIDLPEGSADDPSDAQTVHGVGNAKNDHFLALIHEQGVEPYPGSVRYAHKAVEQGLRCAVVSSSANAHEVLKAAGLENLFEAVIDGHVIAAHRLAGKPAPDAYLAGALALSVAPEDAAVFEDALAGVEAGASGHFGCVVGVNRSDQAAELRAHGADLVVNDLAELLGA